MLLWYFCCGCTALPLMRVLSAGEGQSWCSSLAAVYVRSQPEQASILVSACKVPTYASIWEQCLVLWHLSSTSTLFYFLYCFVSH